MTRITGHEDFLQTQIAGQDRRRTVCARTDAKPFRELYDRYARRVLTYHRRRSHDEAAAHDLTAETFAQVWLSRQRFRDEACGSAGPWIFGIARNVLLTSVRAGTLERRARDELAFQSPPEGEGDLAVPEPAWLEELDEALEELPQGQREAILLRVVEEASYDEVAEELETTPAAARVRVHRGLGVLRKKLATPQPPHLDQKETD